MVKPEGRYLSYLLRLWQTRSQGELIWRASLESPKTGQRRGFANLAELFTFLAEEIRENTQGGAQSPEIDER